MERYDTLRCAQKIAYNILVSVVQSQPVAPVAYQVILEPGIGQFREFEPPASASS